MACIAVGFGVGVSVRHVCKLYVRQTDFEDSAQMMIADFATKLHNRIDEAPPPHSATAAGALRSATVCS